MNIRKNKDKVLMIASVLIILVVFILALCVFVCRNKEEKSNDKKPLIYVNKINGYADYNDLNICVTSFKFTSYFCGLQVSKNSKNYLCVVNVKLHNPTNQIVELTNKFSYKLIYDNDYVYDSVYKDKEDFLLTHKEIMALETITASLCYEVPLQIYENNDKSLIFELKENIKNVKVIHKWKLR